METIKIQLETLTCPSCINKIETVLNKEAGVESAKVMFNSSKVKIEYDQDKTSPEKLSGIIEKLGFKVLK
ncbi:MAG: heavy metal-associated domain-containing protein [Bacteroidales bacterium]|nr:heavy metal-associated domain-containing protein [Bacteroidales bacterium]MDD3522416.1 heavy metal-associated domain-containing protein [Bacteroidales bacterium]MDD4030815.1 heavy metal-associated domain-containing protein [Bacteroidales bacterium]MDD4436159.1 heavy metal-associated domain-containing protein [Bacteroidales bacterium]MDD5732767.1 heavy metal-associated domain-containing protein [Bacteroidales bacterium]